MALTDSVIRSAKPTASQQKLFDGGGLFLLIKPNGSKLWRLKYRIGGREKLLAIGAYDEVTLKQAREHREDARRLIAKGMGPVSKHKSDELAVTSTLESVADEYLRLRE